MTSADPQGQTAEVDVDARAPLGAVGGVAAVIAVILLGINLRLVFGSASSVLTEIRQSYRLSPGSAALLITGPVVCLGAFGPLAARGIRRWSVPVVLTGCLALVMVGTALRGAPLWAAMLLGTLLAGAGIAVANVLGPVLVRLLFPHRIGVLTGLLTALISASAGIASGVTIPIDEAIFHDWRMTLSAWALPAAFAVAALGNVAVRHARVDRGGPELSRSGPRWQAEVLRSPIAWAITGFMGLQSLLAYAMIGWLPTIFRERGMSAERGGLLLTVLSVSSILTALAIPVLAARSRRQSALAVAVVCLSVVGLVGVLTGGSAGAVVWAALLGLGQGGELALALTFVNLRAATASHATSLSTMAQSIGYLVAAIGPLGVGALRSATGSWDSALIVLLALMIPLCGCGWIAGRARLVGRS